MLEQLLIFTRGGLILWTQLGTAALKGSPIDALIRTCLLEDRAASASFTYDAAGASYTLKWAFHNELALVFVAVFNSAYRLLYVDDLLAAVRREFADLYDPKVTAYPGFDLTFARLQREAEARADELKKSKQINPAPAAPVKKSNQGNAKKKNITSNANGNGSGKENADGDRDRRPLTNGHVNVAVVNDRDTAAAPEEEVENEKPGAKKKGWFSSMFQSIAGNAILEKSDLEPALKALKDRLMTKNVAEEIAEKLCESVAASLEGKKLGSFTRVSSTVQAAMEEALLRILTPRRSIDILREVHDAKENGKPYVIVFIGVNGVGKSTNLAKVAYWLQQHDLSVMLAACDTFRSGAVEQLRTHARRLKIDIFEKGYEKDPAVVAKEAIQQASRDNADVVLVDTAGRMQDNEPLMRALSKLINLNNPDLVLFVGEALVGNDAVDQLTKFNQKLVDLSPTKSVRVIDGILLTKFDTIDDKVGAALSMVYISGAPVMFVGCGQSYTDLKKLNVKTIVKTLLK